MPRDQWKFVTSDESLADEEPSEELAMHVVDHDPATPVEDVGRADVVVDPLDADGERAPAVYFPDEEPDDPRAEAALEAADEQGDLEDLLEEQHYAFGDEADDEG